MKGKQMTRKEWEPLRIKRIEEYKAMTVKERRKAFLDDTISHYRYANRAVFESTGDCFYGPMKRSYGCAIGRWLNVKVAKSLPMGSVDDNFISDKLPEWMMDMGLKFLLAVQNLHDSGDYWDNDGLTGLGAKEAASIRRRFKLT